MSDSMLDDYRERLSTLAAEFSLKRGVPLETLALATFHHAGAIACLAFDTADLNLAMEKLGDVEAASLSTKQ